MSAAYLTEKYRVAVGCLISSGSIHDRLDRALAQGLRTLINEEQDDHVPEHVREAHDAIMAAFREDTYGLSTEGAVSLANKILHVFEAVAREQDPAMTQEEFLLQVHRDIAIINERLGKNDDD